MTELSKKVCLLGTFAAGKTSLVRRFVYNRFDDKYTSTIGVKVSRKTVSIPVNGALQRLNMMLWDLDGRSELDRVRASYLRGSAGAVLVCDLTRADTLEEVYRYVDNLQQVSPHCLLVLAANKMDLTNEHQVTEEQVVAVAYKLNAPAYFTSAKDGDNVDQLFRHLGQLLTG